MAIRLARFEAIGEAIEEVEAYANERHDGSDYVQASADLAERLGHLRGRLRATDKASPAPHRYDEPVTRMASWGCRGCGAAVRSGEAHACPPCSSEAQSPSVRDVLEAVVGAGFRYTPSLHGQPTLWCLDCGRDSGTHYPTCKRDLLNAPRSGEASPPDFADTLAELASMTDRDRRNADGWRAVLQASIIAAMTPKLEATPSGCPDRSGT